MAKSNNSKRSGNDVNMLDTIIEEAKGVEYLGYIAYAKYKRDKIEAIKRYKNDHKAATVEDIQREKDNFRNSRCNKTDINRYLDEARKLDNDMYAKKIEEFIQGFENGANGERERLKIKEELINLLSNKANELIKKIEDSAQNDRNQIKKDLEDLLSKKIGEAIDEKYKLEKKSNYFRGVSQSFFGTIIWVIVTIIVGLYFNYGRQYDSPGADINKKQTIIDTVNAEKSAKLAVNYNQ